MHILGILLAVMGTVGIILWRLNSAANAAKGLAETAGEAQGLLRRWGWRRKFAQDSLELVSDPREAAVAIMVALAQSDGAMTERERSTIVQEVMSRFGATELQATEMLAHGRWLTRDVRDPDTCIRRLAPLMKKTCAPDQLNDVIEMAESVAGAEGEPSTIEAGAMAFLKRTLRG